MAITHSGLDEERGFRALIVLVLVGTSAGGAIDLNLDAPESWWSVHAIYERAPHRSDDDGCGPREIALRLLKGHSHKQIAFESGELSAFFLDDIPLPAPPGVPGTEVPVAHGS